MAFPAAAKAYSDSAWGNARRASMNNNADAQSRAPQLAPDFPDFNAGED
jgi:hypothetical protein